MKPKPTPLKSIKAKYWGCNGCGKKRADCTCPHKGKSVEEMLQPSVREYLEDLKVSCPTCPHPHNLSSKEGDAIIAVVTDEIKNIDGWILNKNGIIRYGKKGGLISRKNLITRLTGKEQVKDR